LESEGGWRGDAVYSDFGVEVVRRRGEGPEARGGCKGLDVDDVAELGGEAQEGGGCLVA
jgi:hypothetical protein